MRQIKELPKDAVAFIGIKIPEAYDNDHWSHGFRNWLDQLTFTYPTAKIALEESLCVVSDLLTKSIERSQQSFVNTPSCITRKIICC